MPISNSTPPNDRLPALSRGGIPKTVILTATEISRKVDDLLTQERSNERAYVLELLYQFVLNRTSLFNYSSQVASAKTKSSAATNNIAED
jgi:hypothetical protein